MKVEQRYKKTVFDKSDQIGFSFFISAIGDVETTPL